MVKLASTTCQKMGFFFIEPHTFVTTFLQVTWFQTIHSSERELHKASPQPDISVFFPPIPVIVAWTLLLNCVCSNYKSLSYVKSHLYPPSSSNSQCRFCPYRFCMLCSGSLTILLLFKSWKNDFLTLYLSCNLSLLQWHCLPCRTSDKSSYFSTHASYFSVRILVYLALIIIIVESLCKNFWFSKLCSWYILLQVS